MKIKELDRPAIAVVQGGRFQPYHKYHLEGLKSTLLEVQDRFPKHDVHPFILSSNKVGENDVFDFDDRKAFAELYDLPKGTKILQSRYNDEKLFKKFGFRSNPIFSPLEAINAVLGLGYPNDKVHVIMVTGSKDANRYEGKLDLIPDGNILKPYDQGLHYHVSNTEEPEFGATELREMAMRFSYNYGKDEAVRRMCNHFIRSQLHATFKKLPKLQGLLRKFIEGIDG